PHAQRPTRCRCWSPAATRSTPHAGMLTVDICEGGARWRARSVTVFAWTADAAGSNAQAGRQVQRVTDTGRPETLWVSADTSRSRSPTHDRAHDGAHYPMAGVRSDLVGVKMNPAGVRSDPTVTREGPNLTLP